MPGPNTGLAPATGLPRVAIVTTRASSVQIQSPVSTQLGGIIGPLAGLITSGHLYTQGKAPTFTNINAGLTSVFAVLPSNDIAGRIQFIVGAAAIAAGSRLFTVNYVVAYPNIPVVLLSQETTSISWAASAQSKTTFDVFTTAIVAANTFQVIPYLIIGTL